MFVQVTFCAQLFKFKPAETSRQMSNPGSGRSHKINERLLR